ncbi:MAG: DUF6273 domain-containing protein [Oscillospiraceae bacterium]|nr:DUF6273 domain-containing protein [Oscillospiraceae bacterium]
MKKLLSLLLTLSLILTFTACDTTDEPDDETTAADEAVTEEEATTEETTSPLPNLPPEPMTFVVMMEYLERGPQPGGVDPRDGIKDEFVFHGNEEIFLLFSTPPHHYAFHRNGRVTYIHSDISDPLFSRVVIIDGSIVHAEDEEYVYEYFGVIGYDEHGEHIYLYFYNSDTSEHYHRFSHCFPYFYDAEGTYWVEGHDTLYVNISGQTYKWKLLPNDNIETTGTTIGELNYYKWVSFGKDFPFPFHLPDGEEVPNITTVPDEPATVNVGDIIQLGGYDWRVLDVQDDRAFVITDRIIDNRAYHRQVDAITWADSDIRKWLNGDFYNSFNSTDRARIRQTTVINADNGTTPGGVNTTDYIFLLSVDEANKYSAGIALNSGSMADIWWLRSPADYGYTGGAAFADYFGEVVKGGGTSMTHVGIRPAMWITI